MVEAVPQNEVLGLEISVHDVSVVTIYEGFKDRTSGHHSVPFAVDALGLEVVQQFAALQVLDHELDVELAFIHLIKADDVRVVEHPQDGDLPLERLRAALVFQSPTLLDGLDRKDLPVALSHRAMDLQKNWPSTFAKLPLPNSRCRLYR